MEFNLLDIVQHILNIVVLYIILRAVLYNPVRRFMQQRDEARQQQQQQTAEALESAKASAQEGERQLAEAQRRTQQLVDEKTAYAEKMAAETVESAKAEAARILEEARARAEADQQKAQREFTEQTADIAVELARRILAREVNRADNQQLIDDFFRKVG